MLIFNFSVHDCMNASTVILSSFVPATPWAQFNSYCCDGCNYIPIEFLYRVDPTQMRPTDRQMLGPVSSMHTMEGHRMSNSAILVFLVFSLTERGQILDKSTPRAAHGFS